jgi:hypothetical protein
MIGMMDETTRPSTTDLAMDLQCFTGLRSVMGILDSEMVSISAKVSTVRLALTSAVSTSPGKNPPKLVMRDTINARDIMNAPLESSPFIFMELPQKTTSILETYRYASTNPVVYTGKHILYANEV